MKYTKELLEPIVKESRSVTEVLQKLGIKKNNGGNNSYISSRIKKYGLDTSHFLGQSWNTGKGRKRVGGSKYKEADEILIKRSDGSIREKGHRLRRALVEKGIDKCCSKCKTTKWNGDDLVLEVDHINGDPLDNRIENLRFLCPNCHSQTKNFRRYNG